MTQPERKHHYASTVKHGIDLLRHGRGNGDTAQLQRSCNAHGLPGPPGAVCPGERIRQQCAVVSAQTVA